MRQLSNVTNPSLVIPTDSIAAYCQRNGIQRLALFGSAVREDFRPDSDVDLLVEFRPDARVGFLALSRMQRELSDLLQRQVDLVPRDGLKPQVRSSVLGDAEVLYAWQAASSDAPQLREQIADILRTAFPDPVR
jgi:predicted nucleotidyltransferase